MFVLPGKRVYMFGGSNLECNTQVRTAEFFDIEKQKWEHDFIFRKGTSKRDCNLLQSEHKDKNLII